jgi:hypothetical protein
MKKIYFTLALLAIGIISCSSCAKKDQVEPTTPTVEPAPPVTPPVPPPPVSTSVTIAKENYSFVLPDAGWQPVTIGEGAATVNVSLLNPDKKNLILFTKDEFVGTFPQYALLALRGMKAAGATIVSASQITLNGQKFVAIESSKNAVRVYIFATLVNGYGYGLTCGGQDDGTQHDLCFGIANTLKIN